MFTFSGLTRKDRCISKARKLASYAVPVAPLDPDNRPDRGWLVVHASRCNDCSGSTIPARHIVVPTLAIRLTAAGTRRRDLVIFHQDPVGQGTVRS